MSYMERLCADTGGHGQCGCSRQGGWIIRDSLGNEGGQAYLLEHIEIIVGSRPIRSNADVQPGFEHLGYRRKTRS